jgi:hypothetical protein
MGLNAWTLATEPLIVDEIDGDGNHYHIKFDKRLKKEDVMKGVSY